MRALLLALLLAPAARAQVPRSFHTLPSSNGHGAVMADLSTAKVVHFRERLPATEEPELDGAGNEVWIGNQPQQVKTRDLLFDAYLGLRAGGQQRWLSSVPVGALGSGYEAAGSPEGGSGMVTWQQQVSGLEATTWLFAPRSLPHAGFVLVLRVRNPGAAAVSGVSAFSLQNFRLGFGRPGPMAKLAANGETVEVTAGRDVLERAFAGVVAARPLGTASHALAWNGGSPASQNGFQLVQSGGAADFPDSSGNLGVATDWASGFQFDLGTLAAGAEAWAGIAVVHHPNPFAGAEAQAWLDSYLGARTPQQLVDAERAGWVQLQQALTVPAGMSAGEESVLRQSAAMLAMAQVQEQEAFLREWLASDGQPRRTRFPASDGGVAALPGVIAHRGAGAVLASLPPGEWTYAWVRDGAYSAAALSRLGLTTQARAALGFFLEAEGGRFRHWNELKPYSFPPYLLSLTRYTGFGVEETDFNSFGPNLEFDGFGLVLWALREHERRTGDLSLTDAKWTLISTGIADPLLALIDPSTGLMRKDSSIWESHWLGRERSWTYTNLTAVRGLCDAAVLAERKGDPGRASSYRAAGVTLRKAIASRLVDSTGVLASNLEELESGAGYLDAAVLEAIALGLFDPNGRIARATLATLEQQLRVDAGPGWSRNDDRSDHAGKTDLSPWGSEYDSAEWVFTDLRGAIALRRNGSTARADQLLARITSEASANAQLIPETFDELDGGWKFNAPMIGFGAGAYVLALGQRAADPADPACGAYFDESVVDAGVPLPDAGMRDGGVPDGGAADGGAADGGVGPLPNKPGCGCGASPAGGLAVLGLLLALRCRIRLAGPQP